MSALLLLLADGRLPAGGHAHSGGVEAAVAAGTVSDVDSLAAFLRGRLATAGLVAAAFAAAACTGSDVDTLDEELDARTPSPALRRASRAQGRTLLRAARAMLPGSALPDAAHHAVALGLVARAAGLGPDEAALLAAYGSIAGPASAAVRLLGLDPYAVHAMLARLAVECDRPVPGGLPAAGAPLLDIGAEAHASWEVRLFAS